VSNGNVIANIESIVNNLDNVTWEQALFEAITNSLQAEAKHINIEFFSDTLNYKDTEKFIDEIKIIDNGVGFHSDNTNSFKEYGSQYKRKNFNISAKGIGRFLFLKVFNNVHITSLDREIDFSIQNDINIKKLNEVKYEKTIVQFKTPKFKFFVDYNKFVQKIKEHFIAYFKLLKEEIIITIYENSIKQFEIKSTDIPKFKTKNFTINNHNFVIDYVFNDKNYKFTEGYYCAGDRVVIKNSNLEIKKKLKAFCNINILFLLSSSYLDDNVNATRDDFTIMPKRKSQLSLLHDTSWEDIKIELKNQIREIALENNIDIDEISKNNLNDAINNAPYLAYYLQNNEEGYDSKTLIEIAKEKLEEDKELIRKDLENNQALLSIVTQSELTEYIFDRQRKIDLLKKIKDDNVLEKEIHNLFMKKYTKDLEQNYKSNNLWLFDDRFMTYDKVFSEAQLQEVFPDLKNNLNRTDIISIVSNTYEKEEITDIVLIELKRPNEKITPAEAQRELRSYADYINQSREYNKIRIWAYAFLKFDGDTARDLRLDEYNQIPTQTKYPIFYKYSGVTTNMVMNFLDYESLAYDADVRNKTFMKILNGDSIKENS
jgi:hypothetical protein